MIVMCDCRFTVLVCGTLVYSRGDEVQTKQEHAEYEAHAAEEGEAQPSVLMPGKSCCLIPMGYMLLHNIGLMPSRIFGCLACLRCYRLFLALKRLKLILRNQFWGNIYFECPALVTKQKFITPLI